MAEHPVIPVDIGRTPRGTATTQAALGRALLDLTREAPDAAKRVVTVSPDVSSTTNLAGWVNKVGVWSATERHNWFADDAQTLMHWNERPTGQHMELGIAETNLVGLMNCSRVCMAGMQRQQGGWIWNMEGMGSNGQVRPALAPYGATKCALRYFTTAMVRELKKTPVKVGYLSPGIVITDLLVPPPNRRGEAWQRNKKILNILADTVETVTPFLVEGMLAAKESGTAVRWLVRARQGRESSSSYLPAARSTLTARSTPLCHS